jgi:glycine oxidase
VKGLTKTALPTSRWLDARELVEMEPALSHAVGAMYNPDDGAVDNTMLLNALQEYSTNRKTIAKIDDNVVSIEAQQSSACVTTKSGKQYTASRVVVAAGAWAGHIAGAPLARVVKPARGQLMAYPAAPLRHVAYGPRGYLVPRGDSTIGGSTMEDVGFDATTTDEGIRKVRSAVVEICPSLAATNEARIWAGLRPVTPDMLPIIGPDPEHPSLLYACGHSRNGVLMAPLTGDVIADLVTATPLSHDLSQFRPDRF